MLLNVANFQILLWCYCVHENIVVGIQTYFESHMSYTKIMFAYYDHVDSLASEYLYKLTK